MKPKKVAKVAKEIEESGYLVDYLLAQGLDFDLLCACVDPRCQSCIDNDQQFFSERRVRESKEWKENGNH